MENLSAGETISGLQVLRRNNLRGFHTLREIWRVRGNCFDHRRAQIIASRVPISIFQFVRRELHVGRQDMLTLRRKGWIEKRRNREIEIRSVREFSILGSVEGPL